MGLKLRYRLFYGEDPRDIFNALSKFNDDYGLPSWIRLGLHVDSVRLV
ncbi:MAG: hypothetical protein JWO42_2596 [Chloroflexi bacterium]|nr:hypothetical protein [Chloroflexota bacterium]